MTVKSGITDHGNRFSKRAKIADQINQAFRSSDVDAICSAIGEVTRQYNVSDMAKKSGVKRERFYRAFGGHQHPNLTTLIRVLAAIGLQLQVMPLRGRTADLPQARVQVPRSQCPR